MAPDQGRRNLALDDRVERIDSVRGLDDLEARAERRDDHVPEVLVAVRHEERLAGFEQRAGRKRRRRWRGPAGAQSGEHVAQPGLGAILGDRLQQERLHAEPDDLLDLDLVLLRRQHHDRDAPHLGRVADHLQRLPSVHHRHVQIEDEQVEAVLRERLEGADAVVGLDDGAGQLARQESLQQEACREVVVADQDADHGRGSVPLGKDRLAPRSAVTKPENAASRAWTSGTRMATRRDHLVEVAEPCGVLDRDRQLSRRLAADVAGDALQLVGRARDTLAVAPGGAFDHLGEQALGLDREELRSSDKASRSSSPMIRSRSSRLKVSASSWAISSSAGLNRGSNGQSARAVRGLNRGFQPPTPNPQLPTSNHWRLASLVTQGVDRVESRGLAGRVEAEEHADRRGEAERQADRPRRHRHRPPHHQRERLRHRRRRAPRRPARRRG